MANNESSMMDLVDEENNNQNDMSANMDSAVYDFVSKQPYKSNKFNEDEIKMFVEYLGGNYNPKAGSKKKDGITFMNKKFKLYKSFIDLFANIENAQSPKNDTRLRGFAREFYDNGETNDLLQEIFDINQTVKEYIQGDLLSALIPVAGEEEKDPDDKEKDLYDDFYAENIYDDSDDDVDLSNYFENYNTPLPTNQGGPPKITPKAKKTETIQNPNQDESNEFKDGDLYGKGLSNYFKKINNVKNIKPKMKFQNNNSLSQYFKNNKYK
jgi:hypothetical protein